jgi:hypothetical protein
MIAARARAVLLVLSIATGLSCVLPDLEIVTEDEKITNKQAVRFARSFVLTAEADSACIKDEEDEGCVQPAVDPRDVLPPFLDPRYVADGKTLPYDFCSCGAGERDEGALPLFTLYVEDRDEDTKDRTPKDRIYAALMLDLGPRDTRPYESVAYPSYLDPSQELELAGREYEPALRPPPHLRELTLGDESQQFDLCNRAGGGPLTEGYHTLQIIVTDRAWFQFVDSNGQTLTQTGVPNIAGGATFDITTFVFHCDGKRDDDEGTKGYNEGHCKTQCKGADEEQL